MVRHFFGRLTALGAGSQNNLAYPLFLRPAATARAVLHVVTETALEAWEKKLTLWLKNNRNVSTLPKD